MRKLVFLLFAFTFLFTINLLVYVLSEDYRFLIKKVKYDDSVVYEKEINVTDDQDILSSLDSKIDSNQASGTGQILAFPEQGVIEKNTKKTGPVALSLEAENILARFEKFGLEKVTQHTSLFGITTEYPDEYFEYVGTGATLYFFPTKGYYDIRDIFDTLSSELPFQINQVNNFGEKSFYINLKTGFDDGYIRIVVLWKESVFGLKIKKDVYNEARVVLEGLKIQTTESFQSGSGVEDSTKSTN